MTRGSGSIDIIGAGNVAVHLVRRFTQQGLTVNAIGLRDLAKAKRFEGVDPTCIVAVEAIEEVADRPLILAVNDDSIAEVSQRFSERLLIHTSGSVPLDALTSGQKAVLYPLQTFSHARQVDWSVVPICIEAGDRDTLRTVRELAEFLSNTVHELDTAKRRHLHLAAVVANNFVNYLYGRSARYLAHNGLSFDLLLPLIAETASKAADIPPEHAQTGPARRNDQRTITHHLEMLADDTDLHEVYRLLTEKIIKQFYD